MHIINMIYQCYDELDCLAELVFVSFPHCEVAGLPPLSILFMALWKESLCAAHTQGVVSAEYLYII